MCAFFLHLPNLASQEEERGKMAVRERRGREGGREETLCGMWDKQANEETTKLVEQQIPTRV